MLVSRVAAPPVLSRARIPGTSAGALATLLPRIAWSLLPAVTDSQETRLAWIDPHYAGGKS